MADISVTAASVLKGSGAQTAQGIAGGTITAGQPLYADSSSANQLKTAKSDTAAHAAVVGISLHAALTGQPIVYQTSGNLTFNAALTQGVVYVCSPNNAGGIAPYGDLSAGQYVTVLGVALSTTSLGIGIDIAGITQ